MTVAELIKRLQRIDDKNREVFAWAPGSHMPTHGIIEMGGGNVLIEISVPDDTAIGQALIDDTISVLNKYR
jgi:hypothetical protein